MRDKLLIAFLVIYIFSLLFIKSAVVLLVLFVFYAVLSYKTMLKALKAVIFFNITVSLGYIIQSLILHKEFVEFLSVFNLRVFDTVFMIFYINKQVNLIRVFSFSKGMRFLLSSTLMQISSFLKTYEDFKLALKSRTAKKLKERDKKHFVEAMFFYFFKKSLHDSKERTLALKARGFFD